MFDVSQPRRGFGALALTAAFLSVLCVAALAGVAPAGAAARGDIVDGPRGAVGEASDVTRRIQKALTRMGYYSGVVDGYMNEALRAAIEAYQRANGREPTGEVSESLAHHLETQDRVGDMLQRLKETRERSIEEARKALLENERTRDLLTPDDATDVADPTRDPSDCFAAPTKRCLLVEAVESAKAIFKPELRDWAYGEILVSQAKAGLLDDAIATVRRIGDARLIIVALRDISRAQALEGRVDEARDVAGLIPDLGKQLEALAAVAEILNTTGRLDGARDTALRIIERADTLDDPLRRIGLRAQMAVIFAKAGESDRALAMLAEAQRIVVAGKLTEPDRDAALRHIASAYAGMGTPDRALALLEDVSGTYDRVAVLMSSATAQAVSGRTGDALATAGRIETERYRSVMLGRIAAEMARRGEEEKAFALVAHALRSTERIELPYARSYAVGQIALSLVEIGLRYGEDALAQAVETAQNIENDHLRAYSLWSVANAQASKGLLTQAAATVTLAEQATDKIASSLSQVWMLADLASERIAAGDRDGAERAFDRGIDIARTISNPWGRARALARLAATLHDLR